MYVFSINYFQVVYRYSLLIITQPISLIVFAIIYHYFSMIVDECEYESCEGRALGT